MQELRQQLEQVQGEVASSGQSAAALAVANSRNAELER